MRRVRFPNNIGTVLLSIWLVAKGAVPLLGVGSQGLSTILAILAIAAGVLLFLNR